MQKFISIDPLEPGMVTESVGLLQDPVDFSAGSEVQDYDDRKESGIGSTMRSHMEMGSEGSEDPFNPSPSPFAAQRAVIQQEPAPLTSSSYAPPVSTTGRSRESRAMKEPKAPRK